MSASAHFRQWQKVVELANKCHRRKRAWALTFEGGGRCWWWKTTTTLENEHTRSCSEVLMLTNNHPPQKRV